MARLKSCMKCGRIHSTKLQCKEKVHKNIYKSKAGDLRNTYSWRKKREDIKARDKYICQVCKQDFIKSMKPINNNGIQVHHITPYAESEELFYDDDNLITLCRYHHERAEEGTIDREYLRGLIKSIPPYSKN